MKGKIAYASQEPWIFSGSIRQNILCGSEFDQERYNQVIRVCALDRDLQLFPSGDGTAVGEKGVSLSGGQKARINLARCLYVDADIYLMDDPLSAVDAHVGRHLVDEAIKGFLRDKIRILVTHQLQHLKNVDKILVLKDVSIAKNLYSNYYRPKCVVYSFIDYANKRDEWRSLANTKTSVTTRCLILQKQFMTTQNQSMKKPTAPWKQPTT